MVMPRLLQDHEDATYELDAEEVESAENEHPDDVEPETPPETADFEPEFEGDVVGLDQGFDEDDAQFLGTEDEDKALAGSVGDGDVIDEQDETPVQTQPRKAGKPRAMPAPLTRAAATAMLRRLGFRIRSSREFIQVVKLFQDSWNLGHALTVDGQMGPVTSAALRISYARHKKGLGDQSAHFSYAEFSCKCGGRYASCMRTGVKRAQVARLEGYRKHVGSVSVVSGYRCPGHNKAVGGASSSQHMYRCATDIPYARTDSQVRGYKLFAGIGRSRSTHKVRHVDSRDKSPNNTTGSSVARPMVWNYAS